MVMKTSRECDCCVKVFRLVSKGSRRTLKGLVVLERRQVTSKMTKIVVAGVLYFHGKANPRIGHVVVVVAMSTSSE